MISYPYKDLKGRQLSPYLSLLFFLKDNFTVHCPVLMRPMLPTPDPSATTGLTSDKAPNHNYTDCCVALKVSTPCLGFCNIQSILDGTTGQDPENCEADFPAIVRCMAGKTIKLY